MQCVLLTLCVLLLLRAAVMGLPSSLQAFQQASFQEHGSSRQEHPMLKKPSNTPVPHPVSFRVFRVLQFFVCDMSELDMAELLAEGAQGHQAPAQQANGNKHLFCK
jgi:hypothetical protein